MFRKKSVADVIEKSLGDAIAQYQKQYEQHAAACEQRDRIDAAIERLRHEIDTIASPAQPLASRDIDLRAEVRIGTMNADAYAEWRAANANALHAEKHAAEQAEEKRRDLQAELAALSRARVAAQAKVLSLAVSRADTEAIFQALITERATKLMAAAHAYAEAAESLRALDAIGREQTARQRYRGGQAVGLERGTEFVFPGLNAPEMPRILGVNRDEWDAANMALAGRGDLTDAIAAARANLTARGVPLLTVEERRIDEATEPDRHRNGESTPSVASLI